MAENKKNAPAYYPGALTIGGSDSCGGSGIEADLRTFNALGVYGCAAVTAVTAQTPEKIISSAEMAPETVAAQIEAVISKTAVRCVKTGMLNSAVTVETVAQMVKKHNLKLICDPFMMDAAGRKLMTDDAVSKAVSELLPQALWVTLRRNECELLLGRKMNTLQEYADGTKALADKLQTNVLLKCGGDEKIKQAADFVCYKGKLFTLSSPKVMFLPDCVFHGAGCTLAAAMTALTALAFSWRDVVLDAKAFLLGSLQDNVEIGKGVYCMYPPAEDVLDLIEMTEYPPAGGKKKGVR